MNKIRKITMCLLASVATFVASADLNIGTVAELKSFRDAVNSGNTYSGQTIRLTADIDLAGESWTPIGDSNWHEDPGFQGTFDGQGYKISNFSVSISRSGTGTSLDQSYPIGGLFGINRGTIKNLFVSGANVYTNSKGLGNDSFSGSIAGINIGTITNCCVVNSTIKAEDTYGAATASNNAYSGGVAACNYNSSSVISYCYVLNVSVSAVAPNPGLGNFWSPADTYTNNISNAWDGSNNQVDCVTTSAAYGDMTGGFRQARNFAAWLKNNEFPGADANAEPYTWDENGITPDKHYYFNLTDAKAEDGSYRVAAVVTSPSISSSYVRNDGIVDVYTVDYVDANNNSQTYILYPSGTNVNVQFSLEGWLNDSEDKWIEDGKGGLVLVSDKAGWFVDKVYLTQGSNSLAFNPSYELSDANDFLTTISEENRVETENVGSSNRKLRYQSISLATPSAATTLAYTTINKDNGTMTSVAEVAQSELEVYGGNGYAVVKAVDGTIIAIYDMMGRKVSDAISSGEKMTFELESGIYIINGKKVMVK